MNKESLLHILESHEVFSFSILGTKVQVYNSVIIMWVIMAVLIVLSLKFARGFRPVPAGSQNYVEAVVETLNNFTQSMTGSHWEYTAPFVGTLFLFLILSNTIALFNFMPEWRQLYEMTGIGVFGSIPQIIIKPPTKDINVTTALAVLSTCFVIYYSIRFKKPSGWLKGFVDPSPIILPIKVLEYFIRTLSLSLRLFGNILGAFIIMELLYLMVPLLIPAGFSIYFDIFDGILQAFIFVFLTSLYIGEALE